MGTSFKRMTLLSKALRIAALRQPGLSDETRAEAHRLASISEKLAAAMAARQATAEIDAIVASQERKKPV